MKLKSIFIIAVALSSALFVGCQNDDIYASDFDNALFIEGGQRATTILVKSGIKDFSQSLRVASAKKVAQKVTITYAIDEALVPWYNSAYYDSAVMLPAECYDMPETEAVMSANSALSTSVEVYFKNLSVLDRDTRYVLPVKLANVDGAEVLASASTHYYVFKGAALINVVGDVDDGNYLTVNWKKPDAVNGMTECTVEGLLRARNFDKMINTFMGIEGSFLLRFGDSGFPSAQLQIATSSGNWPSADNNKAIPTNKWVHVAFTYDNGAMKIYIDGKLQSETTKNIGRISWGTSSFNIGKSYDNNRCWPGEMSEVRIWRVARSKEDIAANAYYVDPASEGLAAYWKFDEGAGSLVKDYSANGNDATAAKPMKWTSVSLPETGK